ncbi:aminopeptidase N-like [Photinus pyralis]|nr:aminopeptidase N-like [Photinus pyralis]
MFLVRLMVISLFNYFVYIECQHPDYVLPNNVKPLRYTITIRLVNITNFMGNVVIELEAKEESSNITLHSKNIEIDENLVSVVSENGEEIRRNYTAVDTEKDFYIIAFNENLTQGKRYNLTIKDFTGSLKETKSGFFSAKYLDVNGTEKHFVMTEFEPSGIRKAFPCFDQPNLKATFIMKMIRPSHLHSAFNTPLVETIDLENGYKMDVFKETPIMPTYIVAFIVSGFQYTKSNGIFRILAEARHTQDGSTDFVLGESTKILKSLEAYTEIQYPLDKIDMIAVPAHYYLDGAMENWGLIVFSEKYLLCPKSYSHKDIQNCLTFTTHEIAHQWFGNLATQRSWNYLWLSEGFASYFQYYIADMVEPSWRIMEQYVLEEYEVSLGDDLEYPNESVDFVYTSPDSYPNPNIYYRKASAIIRMTQHILTDEIHRNGLRIYLKNNKFKNTEPVDVFNSYQQAVENANATHLLGNMTVHEILRTWTKHPGYPIVTVTRDYENGKVTFSQKLYGTDGDEENRLWHIPITYALESNENYFNFNKTTTDIWLSGENITIDIGTNEGWILVNKHATGYYRIAYDDKNWERLITYLRSENYYKIPPVNRARLLYDAVTLDMANPFNKELLFNLSLYMQQEVDYIPISAFVEILTRVDIWTVEQEEFSVVQKYIGKMLAVAYKRINSIPKENQTHVDGLCRDVLERIMCSIEHEDCVKKTKEALSSWMDTGELTISASLMKDSLCAVMKSAPISLWEFLLKQYFRSTDEASKQTYMYALACSKNTSIQQLFLKTLFDLNNTVSVEDRIVGLTEISSTLQGAELLIKYIETVDVDDRYCAYFSGRMELFIPLRAAQIEGAARSSQERCLPIAFFKHDEEAGGLIKWLDQWNKKYAFF